MPRKLTDAQRALREQIKLLSAHITQTKRDEREAAKAAKVAAEAAMPKRSRLESRLIARFHQLITQITKATACIRDAAKFSHEAVHASCVLDAAKPELARLIRDYPVLLADVLADTILAEWSAFFLQRDRRAPAPFPIPYKSHEPNP